MPTIIRTIPFIRRRERRAASDPAPPGAPLVLVSASWEAGGAVTVTFDRGIDIAGIAAGAFVINDGENGFTYQGVSWLDHPTPQTVVVECHGTSEYEGPTVLLDVSGANGIVAVDDGGTWAGVNDLELPFP